MFKIVAIILVALSSVHSIPNTPFSPLNFLGFNSSVDIFKKPYSLNLTPLDFFKLNSSVNFLREPHLFDVSDKCSKSVLKWGTALSNGELWAIQMVDSIPKTLDGIFAGHFHTPGHFDECVDVKTEDFQGQHCMIPLELNSSVNFLSGSNDVIDDPFGIFFSLGICVPSTCTFNDINKVLNVINENEMIKVSKLKKNDCSTDENLPFRTEDWVALSLIIFIIILAIASTCYECLQIFHYKNDKPSEIYSAFSIYKNTKYIFHISQSSAQLKCLNGIRVLSMTWVVLGHAYISSLWGASTNTFQAFKYINQKELTPINNAFVSVDSFFFLSGLLVCLVFFRDISKKGSYDVPVAYIHRYVRLTPPFAFLMLIQATLVSRLGNGPFWNNNIERVEKGCRNSWWSGLIYLQNYLSTNEMCLGQSWYLSADMQMFWVSPFILYPMLFFPAIAPFFLILLILAAAFTNFAIVYVNEFGPRMNFLDVSSQDQFLAEYAPFHTRMAPYIIGIFTGYIICGIQAKKIRFKLSWMWVLCGWIVCLSLLGSCLFSVIRFVDADYSAAESAFYLAFHRVGWALALSWIVLACVSGYGGPINFLLSLDVFQPLGKLSYCIFLMHMSLQLIRLFQSKVNTHIDHFSLIYDYFADLLISFFVAIPLCLLFELPFISIDRYFFQKVSIFPFPPPKEKKVGVEEKTETPKTETPKIETSNTETVEDTMEKGTYNPAFKES